MTDTLTNFVPFLLYRLMAKSMTPASAEYAELGLSIQEARVLFVLLHNSGIRVGALADFACIEQSAMSHMLRRLSRNKLVVRDRVAHDNRSVEITLTAKGQRIAERCQRIADSHSNLLLDGVGPTDAMVLRRVLRHMYANAVRWAERDTGSGAIAMNGDTASDR